ESEDQLETLMQQAGSEAKAAFGDATVYIEKYLGNPRHIEFQVFGDGEGTAIHLGERDCSLQRRHQKVIEEAPAPGMDEATREEICAAAVRAAKAVDYEGAGTIEFIADASEGLRADRIFFMEMNTRLQVEHPVTEEITGVDLVEWQLRVASGEAIPLKQDELRIEGWAIEARLYAEDPAKGFLPSPGRVESILFDYRARLETAVEEGDTVSPFYDPMIAKVICHGTDRDAAIEALLSWLDNSFILPITTNKAFLYACVDMPEFKVGDLDTGLIERNDDELTSVPSPSQRVLDAAGWRIREHQLAGHEWGDREFEKGLFGFRLNAKAEPRHAIYARNEAHLVDLQALQDDITSDIDGDSVVVTERGYSHVFGLNPPHGAGAASAANGAILAPMPGKVIAVDVAEGDAVTAGQRLMVLEAMKMEHALTAPFDGTVTDLAASEGGQVQVEAVLCVVEPAE
ncbi:biotin/lipoyl-containing protein, partial [Alteriqipengyuania sp.]|uniref:ATP-binding protein n=1 Tax=Alteriqipengyuania sp. TaxID=2800692 RepID=UPI003516AC54